MAIAPFVFSAALLGGARAAGEEIATPVGLTTVLPQLVLSSTSEAYAGHRSAAEPGDTSRLELIEGSFAGASLLQRIGRKLETSSAAQELRYLADRSRAGTPETVSLAAAQSFSHAARSAARSLLLENAEEQTSLGDLLDRLQPAPSAGSAGAPGIRIDVGVSSYLPRIDVRLTGGAVATRLTLVASGRMGIDLAPARGARTLFHAGYDARSKTIDARCVFRF